MDIKFIGSGPSAKAILYYITDYITKSQLQAHVAYAALELAVARLGEYNPSEDDIESRAKRLLQKAAHSMISKQELSSQQVVSYLMDFEDHFTSHEYRNLYWTSFEAFINSEDPMCDYQWRGHELKHVNVWDFVAQTEKERLKKKAHARSPSVEPEGPNLAEEFSDDDLKDPADSENPWNCDNILEFRGRPMPRVRFLEDHLEDETHCLKVSPQKNRKVPVPIGPALPRRDQPASVEKHARLMLILFKPWRHAEDLRHANQSWSQAFAQFTRECSPDILEYIENMQILHECKDSRDAHYASRR
ncbi:hypothetical protein B0H11DRAFT_1709396, partial [Mycena galericulata]